MTEVEFNGRRDHDRLVEWLETHIGKMNPLDWNRLGDMISKHGEYRRAVLADGQGWRIVNRWDHEVNDGCATWWVEFDRPLDQHQAVEFILRFSS